ncbi:transposase [Pedobacter sp.]|uniref:transposase n=1 Tax=Pedobacter sp. TaxID=1411316 RepID=UPI003BAB36D4
MKIEENSFYHVFNRGNNKSLIFYEESNYKYFLNQFQKYVLPYVDVYAYCLMPNHFHFFIQIRDKVNFEKGIKNFFISYSKSINKSYNRVGSLFQGRYKAKVINSESYYTRIITYIHQNPIKAGLASRMQDYKYSSYNSFVLDKPTLVSKKKVLEWFKDLAGFIADHQ